MVFFDLSNRISPVLTFREFCHTQFEPRMMGTLRKRVVSENSDYANYHEWPSCGVFAPVFASLKLGSLT
jgi:hypothetical protein